MNETELIDGALKVGGSATAGAVIMKVIETMTSKKRREAELGQLSSQIVELGLETQKKLLHAQNDLVTEYEKRIDHLKVDFQNQLGSLEEDFKKRLEEERSKCEEQLTDLRATVLGLELRLERRTTQ